MIATEASMNLMEDGADFGSGNTPKEGYGQPPAVKLSIHNHVSGSLILEPSGVNPISGELPSGEKSEDGSYPGVRMVDDGIYPLCLSSRCF